MTDSIANDNITDPGLWLWQGRPTNARLRRPWRSLFISGLMLSVLAVPVAALGIFALTPWISWHHETGPGNQKAVMPYPPSLPDTRTTAREGPRRSPEAATYPHDPILEMAAWWRSGTVVMPRPVIAHHGKHRTAKRNTRSNDGDQVSLGCPPSICFPADGK
jgi:hypothetical protein